MVSHGRKPGRLLVDCASLLRFQPQAAAAEEDDDYEDEEEVEGGGTRGRGESQRLGGWVGEGGGGRTIERSSRPSRESEREGRREGGRECTCRILSSLSLSLSACVGLQCSGSVLSQTH